MICVSAPVFTGAFFISKVLLYCRLWRGIIKCENILKNFEKLCTFGTECVIITVSICALCSVCFILRRGRDDRVGAEAFFVRIQ